jgi:hypothetical protein
MRARNLVTMSQPIIAAAALLLLPIFGRAGSVIAESTFGSNLDGWTSSSGEVSWASGTQHGGGDPGGFAYFQENGGANANAEYIIAPNKFLTAGGVDWSKLNGDGVISFDHKIINEENVIPPYGDYKITLSGGGNSATWTGPQATGSAWELVSAPLIQSDWKVTGSWTGLLSDVTNFQIQIELVSNDNLSNSIDEEGIDNVKLSAVPEPAGVTLAALSLFGVGAARWRRWRQRLQLTRPS